jgi:hypothetical protein
MKGGYIKFFCNVGVKLFFPKTHRVDFRKQQPLSFRSGTVIVIQFEKGLGLFPRNFGVGRFVQSRGTVVTHPLARGGVKKLKTKIEVIFLGAARIANKGIIGMGKAHGLIIPDGVEDLAQDLTVQSALGHVTTQCQRKITVLNEDHFLCPQFSA